MSNIGDLEKEKFDIYGAVKTTSGDSVQNDAFQRFRVSNPSVIFDSMEANGAKSLVYSEATSGGASISYVANTSSHQFDMSDASGDKATRSSVKLAEYVPGTSLVCFCTGIMGVGATNSRQRMGLFDDDNGVFFEQRDGTIGITLRTYTSGSAVDTHVTQADWNIDKLDGTGVSGKTLDTTKTNIYVIDLQWLGVGRVRFALDIDGLIVPVHQILNANSKTLVYMTTPRLPARFETENVGASTALDDFRMICSSIITEGSVSNDQIPRSMNNAITAIATGTTSVPILSMRLQAAFANKANLRLSSFSALSVGNRDHLWEFWLNPTLTGASFANVDGIAQKDVAASALSGGTLLASVYTSRAERTALEQFSDTQFVLGADLAGTTDILTIAARTLSSTDNVVASFDYQELF